MSFDKGHFSIMGDYSSARLQKGHRQYFDCGEQYVFDPDTGDRADIVDPRTESMICAGATWLRLYRPARFKSGGLYGDLGNYIPGFPGSLPRADGSARRPG